MTKKVFLLEDEALIAIQTEDMLTDLDYDVVASASSLQEALRAAEFGNFDVAVLDINIRGAMSFPVADILTQRGIPFVFASGYAHPGIEKRYAKALALQKPFTMEALGDVLLRALTAQPLGT